MESKQKIKICKRCNQKIKDNEKGVTWITFEGKKDVETIHWHWNCFIKWKEESLENRAKEIYANTINKIIPKFQGMLTQK